MEDACEKMITGSSNGAIAVWDLKSRSFMRVVARDDCSIEQVRLLTKNGLKCIALTSEPGIILCDMENGQRRTFMKPGGMGKCESINVERGEQIMIGLFQNKSIGIFSISSVQHLKTIDNLDFSRAFIDDGCLSMIVPDPRDRALDFYWIQWENNNRKVERPPPVVIAPVVEVKQVVIQKKPSSTCSIF